MKRNYLYRIAGFMIIFICISGTACKKLIEVQGPPTSTNTDVVFSTDATATAALNGVYSAMQASQFTANLMTAFPELSADNLVLFNLNNTRYEPYYRNALSAAGTQGPFYWNSCYSLLFPLNIALDRLATANNLTKQVKDQLIGEAYFMRAFLYYYLVNIYGDVPLVLNSDYEETKSILRTPQTEVYKQIVTDLLQAQNLLVEDFVDGTLLKISTERVRPTRHAATALLARVYLHMGNYAAAEMASTNIISKTSLFSTVNISQVFLKNSKETIWALQPVRANENTVEGKFYILGASGPTPSDANPVYLSTRLLNSFEDTDLRKTSWISSVTVAGKTYPYPSKYKLGALTASGSEYSIVLRLAEQYLIRAEARVQQENFNGAKADLDVIRLRAGIGGVVIGSKTQMLQMVLDERRREMFTEWGHRWFDLKRMRKADEVMATVTLEKGGVWKTGYQYYPVPLTEIIKNPLLKQNEDYQ